MSPLAMVRALLSAAVVMFALNRSRMDVVAVIMMGALPMTGVITMGEALIGLADPNIVLIAALFVIGDALVRTGAVQRLCDCLLRGRGRARRGDRFLMVVVTGVDSLMSSTSVVAIFIPIVLRIARQPKIQARRLMMPLGITPSGIATERPLPSYAAGVLPRLHRSAHRPPCRCCRTGERSPSIRSERPVCPQTAAHPFSAGSRQIEPSADLHARGSMTRCAALAA